MSEKLNLSVLVDPVSVVDEAFRNPALRIKPRSAKRPTIEQAINAVVSEIEAAVAEHITSELKPRLQEVYETHELMQGEWSEDMDNQDEWETMMDELVEEEIAEYTPTLSQDWLGRNTIGTALHLKDGITKFCASLGREYYKQLVYDRGTGSAKSTMKILASAGITKAQIEARLATHNNPTEKELKTMENTQNEELEAVLQKIAAYVGKDHDIMAVAEDLDLASDDDEGLAMGAAPRLGITEDDVVVLQMERLVGGSVAVEAMSDRIQELAAGGAKTKGKKAPKVAKEPKAPKAEKTPKVEKPAPAPVAEDPASEAEGAIDPEVLSLLKDCGGKDATIALGLGISRATYNNYVNGKHPFEPSVEQATYIRSQVVEKLNTLYIALAKIDGQAEPEEVF